MASTLGGSQVITYVELSTGLREGGRIRLTAVIVALLLHDVFLRHC